MDDYISRQAGKDGQKMSNAEAIETLRANYPDACFAQLRDAVDVAIDALKAQDEVGDTISRQAAIESVRRFYDDYIVFDNGISLEKLLKELPPAPVREVKRGKWIWDDEGYHCSECCFHAYGNTRECLDGTYRFCPNCGAAMREDGE